MSDLFCPLLMLGCYVMFGSLVIAGGLNRIASALEARNGKR